MNRFSRANSSVLSRLFSCSLCLALIASSMPFSAKSKSRNSAAVQGRPTIYTPNLVPASIRPPHDGQVRALDPVASTQCAPRDLDCRRRAARRALQPRPNQPLTTGGLMYFPLPAPVRLLDTRPGASPNACSQPDAPIAGQSTRIQKGRSFCTIPANAVAITGNITPVQSGGGWLTLWPSGATQPTIATTNYGANEIINNVFTVGVGADDNFNIYAYTTTEVVIDVSGYYAPPATGGLYFHSLPKPTRLLDTRGTPLNPLDSCYNNNSVKLAAGSTRTQQARGFCAVNGVTIPAAAQSLVGNATVLESSGTSGAYQYITLWPASASQPLVSNGNYITGATVNSPFTVGLSSAGEFKIFTTATTHMTVDVLGYYSTEPEDANGNGLLFNPLAHPVRLLETRPNLPVGCDKPGAPINGQQEYTQLAQRTCDGLTIPDNAEAVVGNTTVINDPNGGQLKLWKSDIPQPLPAVADYTPGQILNRHVTVSLGTGDGAFKIWATQTTDLVIDLVGYFAPASLQATYSLTIPPPTSVGAETTVTVNWTAPAGHSTSDRIAMYRTGAANDDSLDFVSVPTGASGTLQFTSPYQEGAYQFRYLLDPTTSFFLDVARSNNFSVYSLEFPAERLDPINRVGTGGEDLLSGNYQWGTSLVNLPGRAGLDLNLSLSYNSLVWTKSSTHIGFDKDNGFPSPGFRLGLPVVQGVAGFPSPYSRLVEGVPQAYFILILPTGRRVEMREDVPGSKIYLSTDASNLRLRVNPNPNPNNPLIDQLMLYSPDGSKYLFGFRGNVYQCEKIIDRNGNYLAIVYQTNQPDLISYIQDTLGRKINFVYDSNTNQLLKITQDRNATLTATTSDDFVWASFAWADKTINTNFGSLMKSGPANGAQIPCITRVSLSDGTYYRFDYNTYGQIRQIEHFANGVTNSPNDDQILSTTLYNFPSDAQTDCPRFSKRTDVDGLNPGFYFFNRNYTWGVSSLSNPNGTAVCGGASTCTGCVAGQVSYEVNQQNLTTIKEAYMLNGWQRGVTACSIVKELQSHADSAAKKRTLYTWEQDNMALTAPYNPRLRETNIYDDAGNRRRTETTYKSVSGNVPAYVKLPEYIKEYNASASTVYRTTQLKYVHDVSPSAAYVQLAANWDANRWLIGMVAERDLYEGATGPLKAKSTYSYDDLGEHLVSDSNVPNQESAYNSISFQWRGNLTQTRRWDVTTDTPVTAKTGYGTSGSVRFLRDAMGAQTTLGYTDNFSQGSYFTRAYPTQITDPDGFASTRKYDFHTGLVTETQNPAPAQGGPGAIFSYTYDNAGRLTYAGNSVNAAYTSYSYDPRHDLVSVFTNVEANYAETYTHTYLDGFGRTAGIEKDHPKPEGQRSSFQEFVYDNLGRLFRQSNPTEVNPGNLGTAVGDDAQTGFFYTEQTYDWQGRPLVSTNQDGTTRSVSYAGCGCAGGGTATIQGEPTTTGTPENRRTQKIWRDALGRAIKSQILDYSGSAYSTTLTEYNVRDQATVIKTLKGDASIGASCPLGTCEQAEIVYDGHGRPQKRYLPIYQDNNVAPPYNGNSSARSATRQYYNDDQIHIETDPRGATATYTYNNRGLVTGMSYSSPSGVSTKPNVSFGYDELGNRTAMHDGAGSVAYEYNTLGQMTSESRTFTLSGAPSGPFTINYEYGLAGQLKMVKDPFNDQINYGHDKAGKLISVTGAAPFAGVTNYLSGVQYRAWRAVKNNRTYDERLRLTSAGAITYQYNKANDLIFADMTTLSPYDQTFSYDHVGRLTGVSTPEITVPNEHVCTSCTVPPGFNGLPPNTKVRPFTTSVSYDEFDNATNTASSYWHDITPNLNPTPQSFQTTYVNGRAKKDGVAGKVYNNQDETWTYNAMGQITNDTRTAQTSDAAGQMTRTDNGPNIYVNYVYDGDGRQVKFDQKRDDGATELRYRIHSSVFGGVLTDVGSTGQKIETWVYRFVYEQDSVRQVKAYTKPGGGNVPDTVVFEGSDPHGTRATVWDRNTNTSKTLTLAAPGAYVEDIDWAAMKTRYINNIGSQVSYGQYAASQYLASYFSNIDPRNPGMGCSLDGQKVQCGELFKNIRQESLGRLDLFSPLGVFTGPGFTVARTTDLNEDNLSNGYLNYVGRDVQNGQSDCERFVSNLTNLTFSSKGPDSGEHLGRSMVLMTFLGNQFPQLS